MSTTLFSAFDTIRLNFHHYQNQTRTPLQFSSLISQDKDTDRYSSLTGRKASREIREVHNYKSKDSRVKVIFEAFNISELSVADFTNHPSHELRTESSL